MHLPKRCAGCDLTCHVKRDGILHPRDCYLTRYLRNAYAGLLTGTSPTKEIAQTIIETDFKPNSLVYYPHERGQHRAAALIMMQMRVAPIRILQTHTLINVYVSKSEEEVSLDVMYAPFYLMLHGFMRAPNKRLMDLVFDFMELRILEKVPFLFYTIHKPDGELEEYFKGRGLASYIIGTGKKEMGVF